MKKSILILLVIIVVSFQNVQAQTGNWLWAKSGSMPGSTGGNVTGIATCADVNGNVIDAGYFNVTSITSDNITLNGTGYQTIFIAKYNAAGNVLWAKAAGGANNDAVLAVCADAGGNIIATGRFSSPSLTFGNITITNNSPGFEDVFVVKFDAAGNALWGTNFGGNYPDYANGIATDAMGNIYLAGLFRSDTISFGTTTLYHAGYCDAFVAKLDASGNALWANSGGGSQFDEASSISVDAMGNVFITGQLDSYQVMFGSIILTGAGSSGYGDLFIAKYNTAGNLQWVNRVGTAKGTYGNGIVADASGNVTLVGSFNSDSVTFGNTTLYNTTGADTSDFFIVKYNTAGNVLWAKSGGGNRYDCGNNISADAANNIYVLGGFYSPSVTFGSATVTAPASNCPASSGLTCPSAFLLQLDSAGNALCSTSFGSCGPTEGLASRGPSDIYSDAVGNVYVTGHFFSTNFTLGNTVLNLNGLNTNSFIAKYSCTTTSLNNLNDNADVEVYPNPFTNDFTISGLTFPAQVKIVDVIGQEVLSQQLTAATGTLQTTNLARGVYVLEAITGKQHIIRKVIKR